MVEKTRQLDCVISRLAIKLPSSKGQKMELSLKFRRTHLPIFGGLFLTEGFLFRIFSSPRREFISVIASSSPTFLKTAEKASSGLSKNGNSASRINKHDEPRKNV
jgi:hypothetical protein